MRASLPHSYLYDLHQNDTVTGIGCLAAGQTTDHWAQATGLQPGCDMTRRNFSYKEGNAVCSVSPSSPAFAGLLRQVELGLSANAKAGRVILMQII